MRTILCCLLYAQRYAHMFEQLFQLTLYLALVFVFFMFLSLIGSIFVYVIVLALSIFVFFDYIVFGFVSLLLTKTLTGKNIDTVTCVVLSGM